MSNHTNGHFKKKDNLIHEFLFTKYPFSSYFVKYFIYFHGQQSNKKKEAKDEIK